MTVLVIYLFIYLFFFAQGITAEEKKKKKSQIVQENYSLLSIHGLLNILHVLK